MWAFEQLNGYVEGLPETLQGLYGRVFAQLELKYGEVLTQTALVKLCSVGLLRMPADGANSLAAAGEGEQGAQQQQQQQGAHSDSEAADCKANEDTGPDMLEPFLRELKALLRVHEACAVVASRCRFLHAAVRERYGRRRVRDATGADDALLVPGQEESSYGKESHGDGDEENREERDILDMLDNYDWGGEGSAVHAEASHYRGGDGDGHHGGHAPRNRSDVFGQVLAVTRQHREQEQERRRREQHERERQVHDAKIWILESGVKAGCEHLHEVRGTAPPFRSLLPPVANPIFPSVLV